MPRRLTLAQARGLGIEVPDRTRRRPAGTHPSKGEATFAHHCKLAGLEPVRELAFHPTRGWRFDFAFPDAMLAVEIQGGTRSGKSRHSKGEGFTNDCRKVAAAAALGWRVIPVTTAMVASGEALELVQRALAGGAGDAELGD